MNNDLIKSLLDALEVSPDNIPLRMQVAHMMLTEKMFAEAAAQYQAVLDRNYGDVKARLGLASAFCHQKKYSAAIIIYEQLQADLPTADMMQYIKCLIHEGSVQHATQLYQQLLVMNPGFSDEEIDQQLRMPAVGATDNFDDFGDEDDDYLMEKPALRFSDVGGMARVKDEIAMKIIEPLKNPDLYKAFGKKIGGGILLYGPPGCGKTFIARATAGEINAKFVTIGLHEIFDMWVGNSEKNLHAVFEKARQNAPCVLFFDEVDALGASRNDLRQSAVRNLINQFLAEMDGVDANNEGVLILAATNAPWSVDPAFRRPGRFDRIIFVEPPDDAARQEMLTSMMKEKPAGEIDIKKIAASATDYSGADLKAVVDIAVEDKLRESMSKGSIQPITTKDLLKAVKQHRPTTLEWFATARNYALYANESGLYDDILRYLKIKGK